MSGSKSSAVSALIYNPTFRSVVFQVSLIVFFIWFIWWIGNNTLSNLAAQGKTLGFRFLTEPANFQILNTIGTWVFDYQVGKSTFLDVYFIGIVNTFTVAFSGILAATVIGFTIGIMRLSSNFILRGFATVYIEVLRNLPLLLQLFFWYFAVLRALPGKRERVTFFGESFGINITGLYMPQPIAEAGFSATAYAFAASCLAAWGISRWARKRQERTGQQFPAFWTGLGVIIIATLLVFLVSGSPMYFEFPEFKQTGPILRRGYQTGVGMSIPPEMVAVWLALTLYTASFIAEIVRAGILAVNYGQTEASQALGLRQGTALRLVIIPQALRVIVPPLTSQYLNLTKNSSLSVAIAYPELVSVFAGTALNQVGKEIEMIFMMMMVYLTFSLLTSAFMNWFNSRVKLVER